MSTLKVKYNSYSVIPNRNSKNRRTYSDADVPNGTESVVLKASKMLKRKYGIVVTPPTFSAQEIEDLITAQKLLFTSVEGHNYVKVPLLDRTTVRRPTRNEKRSRLAEMLSDTTASLTMDDAEADIVDTKKTDVATKQVTRLIKQKALTPSLSTEIWSGQCNINGTNLSDSTADFIVSNVQEDDFIKFSSKLFKVSSVVDSNSLILKTSSNTNYLPGEKGSIVITPYADTADSLNAKYFDLYSPDSTSIIGFYVWYNVDQLANDPNLSNKIGIEVALDSTADVTTIIESTKTAIENRSEFTVSYHSFSEIIDATSGLIIEGSDVTSNLLIECVEYGETQKPQYNDTGFAISSFTPGRENSSVSYELFRSSFMAQFEYEWPE